MKVEYIYNNQRFEVEIDRKKKLEPNKIVDLFKKKFVFFSKPCRKNNLRFFINGGESREPKYPFLNAPHNSILAIVLIGDFVTINYWEMQFNFQENEPISDVIDAIKDKFKETSTVSIFNENNLLYKKEDLIKKTKFYRIEVQCRVCFIKDSTGTKLPLYLDYYSTVGDAQEQISAIKSDTQKHIYVPPEKVQIRSKAKISISDPNALLCNIQDLHDEFLYDYQISYSLDDNHKKHKKHADKKYDANFYNSYNYLNNSPRGTHFNFPVQNTPQNPYGKGKQTYLHVKPTQNNPSIQKPPKNPPKPVGLPDQKPSKKPPISTDTIQITFQIEGSYPFQKEVPLSSSIEYVKDMISSTKGLNKEKISIKYEKNDQQIEVPTGSTMSDIRDLMKSKIGTNKEIYLLFVSTIDDQKPPKKSIQQFKPSIKKEENNDDDDDDDSHNEDDSTEIMNKSKHPRISKFKSKITVIQIGQGKKPKIPSFFSIFSKNLINSCLNFEPKDRPSFELIVEEIEKNEFNFIDMNNQEKEELYQLVQKHKELIPPY